ncbi:hypothetical protein CBS147343_1300 [Aspergillus niger]|nr:hypothetical protein CBS11350_3920 [Aspergillus niger]KAI2973269.1 hypothetical protein CBS147324_4046 [Aspergillus niger]KAI3090112.1 hypothetical protein CBS147343_1300 [Aspergillus niger]
MTEDLQEDDGSSDESDNDEREDHSKTGVSQQRITQNAKFKALLAQRADTGPIHDVSVTHDLPDAQLSTAHLVAKQDLGIEKELNDRVEGKPHRIAFFLVDSVTLAYQQAAVLRNNLDQSVGHFFGAMGTDLWSKSVWDQHFQKNMVIVCTAEILNQCLLNSYIKMSQINILIFDEAHHTKKDHPYARIIRDSYLEEVYSKRPRIFGMTASPIDTKGDIVDEATRLEKLLDSRIATTSNMSLLRQVVRRPVERVWSFNKLEQPFATSLYKHLEDRFGDMACLEGIFRFAWQASSELGRWCSDRAWARALADDVLPKLEGSVRKTANSETSSNVPESAYKEILRITEASEVVKSYAFSSPETFGQLSPKVQVLREELARYFGRQTETKCIVFTQKRYTALILAELFQTLDIPFLRPGVLIGVRSGDLAGMNITFLQQFISLVKFRTGEINCLFATSVAEEGLDIPDCNLVVRFDLYQTLIQYVQSRGRARHFNSTYASMVERGNLEHEQRLLEVQDAELLLSEKEVDALTVFTLRVFRDVFHKTYDKEPEKMAYWLAPAKVQSSYLPSYDPRQILDWESLTYVRDNDSIPFSTNADPESWVDLFVFDAWDGRCRFFTVGVEHSLTPSSPPPPFVARRRHMNDVMNYCLSLSKNSRAKFLSTCHWDQPVLRAELVRLRRNLLDKMTHTERDVETRCFICIEPLKASAIPASTAFSCLAFPAIISRIDAYLISLQGCESLNFTVKLDLALEAFTKDSDNTDEHRAQQIHVQRGMGRNYERLEFLGDCFLKMATSIALFTQNPDDDEFDYHVNRMCLICNKNLFNAAVDKEIYKYIRSRGFSRHTWYPEGLKLLQGKDHSRKATTESKHALAEKTIADVCEALIGAALLSGGPDHRFDMAVKAVTTLVNSPSHKAERWKDYISFYTIPKYQRRAADGAELYLSRKIEDKLSYRFRYPTLLGSAFTHPSYPSAWAKVPCYQRLEFLGDSLIDMVCVEDLFARFPDRDPQWLTEHKMAMVSNKFLGALAVKLGLHTHLKYFSAPLQSQITQYAEEIQTAEGENEGAVDYWTVTKDPPKCLPDMVEAYVGAVFVDSDFNFEVIERFFRDYIKPFFEDMAIYDTFANKHPTTFLHNRLTNEFGCVNYCLKAGEMPSIDGAPAGVLAAVIVHDVVIAEGTATSGRYAKVKASEKALAVLDEISSAEFQRKFRCDCRESGDPARLDIGTAI